MKKLFNLKMAMMIFVAAGLIFTGCDKTGNGGDLTINAQVENGASYNNLVDEVRVVGKNDITIASAPFQNGGFTITLTEQIDERVLTKITDYFESAIKKGIKVNNKNVNMVRVSYMRAYKDNSRVEKNFYLYGDGGTQTEDVYVEVVFFYVDSDVKVTGSYDDDGDKQKYDLTLKKGWNTVYLIETEKITEKSYEYSYSRTTKKPNVDFKWYWEYSY